MPTYTHRKIKPADERRIAELEAAAHRRGQLLAPRGECPACDAGRGLIWPDAYRRGAGLCETCQGHLRQHRELQALVAGWGEYQKAVAEQGGWTPDLLKAHAKALHPEETRR